MSLKHVKTEIQNLGGIVTEHRDPESIKNGEPDQFLIVEFPSISVSWQVEDYLRRKGADHPALGWYWNESGEGTLGIFWGL